MRRDPGRYRAFNLTDERRDSATRARPLVTVADVN